MNPFKKIMTWYLSKQALPYWSILILDCAFVMLADYAVYGISQGSREMSDRFWELTGTFAIYLIPYIIGFRLFHTYSGVIRFSSFVDLQKVGLAMGTGLVVDLILRWLFNGNAWYNLEWLRDWTGQEMAISALVATLLMWALRIWVKNLYDGTLVLHRSQRVLVYGIREGGVGLAKSINNQESSPYKVAGFLTDELELARHSLLGNPVYAIDKNFGRILREERINAVIVSPLKNGKLPEHSAMVDTIIDAGVKLLVVPPSVEWDGNHDISYTQLKEVDVEDLLPRDKIEVDMKEIKRQLRGKRILITGAAGSIGSEMVRQVASFDPAELILLDQAETPLHDIRLMMARKWPDVKAETIVADIANSRRMEEIFAKYRPEYVFHAAAYKHVPMMEDNPQESIANNVEGTRILADMAVKYGTRKFVMVSTDKAVNPTNVMGCSKRLCEIYVQALDKAIKEGKVKGDTTFVTTRFGNVLGSNGSVIPLFERQIKAGGPVTVTHPEIIRFFMLIPEACKLVLEAGTMGQGGEIFVFDMGNPVRIADLAKRMIRMSGAKNIEIKYTGLRDGEKLYEEVLNDKEITLPTFHPKIKIAKVREYDFEDVRQRMGDLVELATYADDMTVVAAMKAIVPEFRSQHSKYQALDKDNESK